jgi:hypothetical protein
MVRRRSFLAGEEVGDAVVEMEGDAEEGSWIQKARRDWLART